MSTASEDLVAVGSSSKGNRPHVQFPWRLHELLADVEKDGRTNIISWLVPSVSPDGKQQSSFKVHDKKRFTEELLPQYYNATKFKSFQRNLNLGFETIVEGPNRGGVFHPMFLKEQREKCHYMTRQKNKGTSNGNNASGTSNKHATSEALNNSFNNSNSNLFQGSDSLLGQNSKLPSNMAAARAAATAMASQRRDSLATLANLATAGLSSPSPSDALVSSLALNQHITQSAAAGAGQDLKLMSFPRKIHHILSKAGKYDDCMRWTADGRCIQVVDPFRFSKNVSPLYFNHSSFSSFLVELESYGFQKVTHQGAEECYYHDLMIRGCSHLCKYMDTPNDSRRFASRDPQKDLSNDPSAVVSGGQSRLSLSSLSQNAMVSGIPRGISTGSTLSNAPSGLPSNMAALSSLLSSGASSADAAALFQQQQHQFQQQRLAQQLQSGAALGGLLGVGTVGKGSDSTTAANALAAATSSLGGALGGFPSSLLSSNNGNTNHVGRSLSSGLQNSFQLPTTAPATTSGGGSKNGTNNPTGTPEAASRSAITSFLANSTTPAAKAERKLSGVRNHTAI